jgi:hypothetical protein
MSLPGNYNICQFCGADVSAVPRPPEQLENKKAYKMVTQGTMNGFYAVSALYVLIGAALLCLGLGLFGTISDFMKNIYIVFGGMTSLIGIGLLFRAAFVYAMMPIFCGLQFVLGVVFIIASIMTIDAPALKYGSIGLSVIQILAAGLMFYFSEETSAASMSS